jgi:hypothetical protein
MNIHTSAKALILEAAEKSGLLREVAELLWFANKHSSPPLSRALLDRLTDAFDDHICLPAIVAEDLYGDGVDISPWRPSDVDEVDAFLG